MKIHENRLECLICKKSYQHLGSHIWHKHKILARDYKEKFELPFKMALISQEVYDKKRKRFEEDRDKYLSNLKKYGSKFKFKKGHTGQRRISRYERKMSLERIISVNKLKKKLEQCPVCKMTFNHIESHLYTKHRLLKVK